ncbi:Guanine nucleotide-binding protein subunit alpha-15 [Myotis brandtii]|uniref:Guanine nucleotide-binding protein subunit alpha-15 n=1 Tax=Myotis brandtii TaxID=109478 RepID=S7NZC0_MYOBR|nr:PREDICTED: guanine nucleotide-binding protein subunit alpha-15 [Myotis brandtii]EPQ03113.1 Guanine nucleotide-binding protein subunit alpha-15 [Myotis brandtii]
MARSLTWHCCPWCLTEEEKTAARIDQEINKILLEQKKRDRGELKLLLLGPGESGKSTFIKQMRIIHGTGYSEEDRKGFRPLVYQNIFASMRAMIEAMDQLQIPFSRPESKNYASLVMSQDPYKVTTFEKRYAVAMQWLWSDGGIRACYERRREFHLLDSAVYYLSHLERITEEGYIPTAQDVLRSRMPTTGINEYCFSVQKTNLRIVDVGGQRSERKKWIHCFENVIALIYLASLSEYDQCLEENNQETIEPQDSDSQVFVLPTTLTCGPKQDAEAAKQFILDMYSGMYAGCADAADGGRKGSRSRRLFSHYTCATDTQNIRTVFKDVRDSVLARYLDEINLL